MGLGGGREGRRGRKGGWEVTNQVCCFISSLITSVGVFLGRLEMYTDVKIVCTRMYAIRVLDTALHETMPHECLVVC